MRKRNSIFIGLCILISSLIGISGDVVFVGHDALQGSEYIGIFRTDPTEISETQTGFSHYFAMSRLDNTFWKRMAHKDGRDIRVTEKDSTTLIPFVVPSLDVTNQTGALFIQLDKSTSKPDTFTIQCGNSTLDFLPKTDANGEYNVFTEYDNIYTLSESGGTNAADHYKNSTGSGEDGVSSGSSMVSVSGPLEMNATESTGSLIKLPNTVSDLLPHAGSVSFWLKFTDINDGYFLFYQNFLESNNRRFYIPFNGMNHATRPGRLTVGDRIGGIFNSAYINNFLTADWFANFYHLAITFNAETITVYVNGTSVTMNDQTITGTDYAPHAPEVKLMTDNMIMSLASMADGVWSANKVADIYENQANESTWWDEVSQAPLGFGVNYKRKFY